MKPLRLILIFCSILIFSCATDTDDLLIEEERNIVNDINNPLLKNEQIFGSNRISTVPFENTLQWASYIAAQTIMSDSEIRTEVFNKLNDENAVSFEELIGGGESNNSLFKAKFIAILESILRSNREGLIDPRHGMETPPPPVIDCGCLAPEDSVGLFAGLFINTLLLDNCIELYMPDGFSPFTPINEIHSITSTAHPLNGDDFNNGIIHYSEPIFNGLFDVITKEVDVVDSNYLTNINFDVVIVTRPVRTSSLTWIGNNSCSYTQYPDIDFTDFLDN